jgi:hypothetical protein
VSYPKTNKNKWWLIIIENNKNLKYGKTKKSFFFFLLNFHLDKIETWRKRRWFTYGFWMGWSKCIKTFFSRS